MAEVMKWHSMPPPADLQSAVMAVVVAALPATLFTAVLDSAFFSTSMLHTANHHANLMCTACIVLHCSPGNLTVSWYNHCSAAPYQDACTAAWWVVKAVGEGPNRAKLLAI
jgi:hypothetical protein